MAICAYKFLVIDDAHLWRIHRLQRRVNQAIKHAEPVLTLDAPWERGISDLGQNVNVIFDEDDGLFKMWYCPRFRDNTVDRGSGYTVAYAISRDGVNWEKPIMNMVELGGSRANNCILNQNVAFTMLRDPRDVPSRRYKMIFWMHDSANEAWARFHCPLSLAYSADGIVWDRPTHVNPVLRGSADGVIGFFYDTDRFKYVLLMRRVPNLPRDVSQYESYNLVDWEDAGLVMVPDDDDPPDLFNYQAMTAFAYHDLHLGMLVTHYSLPNAESYEVFHRPPTNYPNQRLGQLDVQLAYTRDGRNWKRPADRSPVIPNGEPGSPDAGMNFVWGSHTVLRDGETWIYYHASPARHNAWAGAHGAHLLSQSEREQAERSRAASCMLAKMPEDHWISLDGDAQGGWCLTDPWGPPQDIFVNADVNPGGSIEVEIITPYGQPIEGFSRGDCVAITTGGKRQPVNWKSGNAPHALTKEYLGGVCLKFHIRHAKLYSYTLTLPDLDGKLERDRLNARWLESIKHRSDNWERSSTAPPAGDAARKRLRQRMKQATPYEPSKGTSPQTPAGQQPQVSSI